MWTCKYTYNLTRWLNVKKLPFALKKEIGIQLLILGMLSFEIVIFIFHIQGQFGRNKKLLATRTSRRSHELNVSLNIENELEPMVEDEIEDPFAVRGRQMESYAAIKFAKNILIYLGLGIEEKNHKLVFQKNYVY